MNNNDAGLTELAGAILDGTPVDWEAADSGAAPHDRRLVTHLRAIAAIAEAHRGDALETWGPLRLLEGIGRGAFGDVYRAWDSRLDREVALKLLPADPSSSNQLATSIIEEGRLLARIRHPNVVTVHGAERIDDRVGLWMEYVDGRTLHQLVVDDGRRFTPREIASIGHALCSAVAAVHAAGLLHRDIKAQNVMMARDGRVVLMDLGSGRDRGGPAAVDLAGTPLYLAPEVLAGVSSPSVQSDIYSIGVLLFFLLTGSYPVTGADLAALCKAHERGERRVLRAMAPKVPRRLLRSIDRALDPQPAHRHESAAALGAGLMAHGPRAPANRWLVGLAASGLIAVALGVFLVRGGRFVSSGSISQGSGATDGNSGHAAAPSVVDTQRLTQSGDALSAAISPDGRFVIYVEDQAGSSSLWLRQLGSDTSQQIVPPADVRYWQPTISPDGQSLYFMRSNRDESRLAVYRMPVTGSAPARLIYQRVDLQGVLALSPDGRRIALTQNSRTRDESVVLVVDANGGGERIVGRRKYSAGYWQVAWSPDGRSLAAVVGNADSGGPGMSVVALNVDDGAEKAVITQPMGFVGNLAWLADGSGLLMVASDAHTQDYQIWYLSYPNGAVHKITDDATRYGGLSLSADSTALVTGQHRRRRTIWVAPTNLAASPRTPGSLAVETARARQIASGYIRLCWTPDGQVVYTSVASGTTNIRRANSDGTNPRQLTTVGLNEDPDVSPDGRVIVFTSIRGEARHIWRMDSDGGNAKQLTHGDGETKPRITPDGESIVYNSAGDATLWRMPLAGGESTRLTQTYARQPAVSPDGSLIAYNFRNTHPSPQWKIAVIPANGGTPLKLFDRHRAEYQTFELHWTPDGRAITYEATRGGVSNIWSQPLTGGPPQRLTDFTTDYIYGFAWSFDGKQLATVRGAWHSDVLLFSLRR